MEGHADTCATLTCHPDAVFTRCDCGYEEIARLDAADQEMTRGKLSTSCIERDTWLDMSDRGIEIEPTASAALIRDVRLLLQMLRDARGVK